MLVPTVLISMLFAKATEGLAQLIDSKGGGSEETRCCDRLRQPSLLLSLLLNLLKFWLHTESNLMYLKVYRPTPELSFAVRHPPHFAGIMENR